MAGNEIGIGRFRALAPGLRADRPVESGDGRVARVAAVRQHGEQGRDLQRRVLVTRLERALPRLGEHGHRQVGIGLDRFGGRGQQDGQPVGGHPGTQLDQAADVPGRGQQDGQPVGGHPGTQLDQAADVPGRGQQDGQPVGGHPGTQLDQAADVP